jgi:hypothetical protein
MGKFKVRRFECRAAILGRAGRDIRFARRCSCVESADEFSDGGGGSDGDGERAPLRVVMLSVTGSMEGQPARSGEETVK